MDSMRTLAPPRSRRRSENPAATLTRHEAAPATIPVGAIGTASTSPTPETSPYRGTAEFLARSAALGLFATSSLLWLKHWFVMGGTLPLTFSAIAAVLTAMCVQRVFSFLLDSGD